MISITMQKNQQHNISSILVSGHAEYAPYGQDIVCASISVLLQTVGFTLIDREDTCTQVSFETSGLGSVNIGNPSRDSYLITSVFEKGANLIAEQYPKFVQIETT